MQNNFGFMEVSAKMGLGAKEAIGRLVTGKYFCFTQPTLEIYNVQNGIEDEEIT